MKVSFTFSAFFFFFFNLWLYFNTGMFNPVILASCERHHMQKECWKARHSCSDEKKAILSYIMKVCLHTCVGAHTDCACTHIGRDGCLTTFLRTGWSWSRMWAILFPYVAHQKWFTTSCQSPSTQKLLLHMLLFLQMCRQFFLLWSETHQSRF